ncbi:MAG: carbonic anhydrase [Desulfobulbaceae bacterium]|nr:carbonic anhydrase [Desulfobulbaceae bacterium]HIJ79584.1 carbonic anhydrase [Deltaproteobacteria bacterium]
MRAKTYLITLCLIIAAIGVTNAKMRPAPKLRAGLPPYVVIEKILKDNDQAIAGAAAKKKAATPSTPYLTWLADCDARVQAGLFFTDPEDKVYTARNFGNQLILSLAAVDHGVETLHTPILLITGNTDSEPIRLFIEGYAQQGPAIRQSLDHLHLPLTAQSAPKKAGTPPARHELTLVEQNVDFQVSQALKRYEQRVKSGRLVVVGAVLDLANLYDRGRNRLVLININGEVDPKNLQGINHLIRLDQKLRALVGRRAVIDQPKPAKKNTPK